MISSVLFDFGGTLDADGQHWLDRFYRIYETNGLESLPKETIKEAFYWAEDQAVNDAEIRSCNFRQMVERHVHWQFQKLGLQDTRKEEQAVISFVRPAERILHRNRHILETLNYGGFKLGVVSNNYGNLEILCREFGYDKLMKTIIDSVVVGLRKPDPRIFQRALQELNTVPPLTVFVGDSLDRDLRPANQLGMRTLWLNDGTIQTPPDGPPVDGVLHSLEELPACLKDWKPAGEVRV